MSWFAILGPLVAMADQRRIQIRAAKQRVLLAMLLLSANRVVAADRLIDRLWDADQPSDARRALQIHLSRLRGVLGAGDLIRTEQNGYLIALSTEELDLLRFRDLMSRARKAEAAGDHGLEANLLRDALALYQGRPLVDIPSDTLQREEVPHLEEEWFNALHRRFDLELMTGNHEAIVGDLRNLVGQYPTRERLCAQLMVALYRSGQQAEALNVYRTVEANLREELGLDVGQALRRVHQAVLAHDVALDIEAPVQLAPPALSAPPQQSAPPPQPNPLRPPTPQHKTGWVTQCQLPADLADFVGRAEELEGLSAQFDASADTMEIVALSGMPGVGKTAFAVHLAHRLRPQFPDGQLYVRLGGSGEPSDPADVLADLLEACGMSRAAVPAGLEQRSALFRTQVADKRVLLVLDDAASTEQVIPLLPGTSGAGVLVTSRSVLAGLAGAKHLRLEPFHGCDAVELLGRMTDAGWIEEQRSDALQINAACGGLPLALRIAGARLMSRFPASVASFAERLHNEQRLLSELTVDNLAVRASLEECYAALDPVAQAAFRRLGLLGRSTVSGWAVGVLVGDADGDQLLDLLAQANLVTLDGLDAAGEPRYRLGALPAAYAAELAETDDACGRATLRRYHLAQIALVESACRAVHRRLGELPPIGGPDDAVPDAPAASITTDPMDWLLSERAQLSATIARCCALGDHLLAARLADLLVPVFTYHSDLRELTQIQVAVRDAALAAGDERIGWRSEYQRALLLLRYGSLREARRLFADCVAAFERMGASQELGYALLAEAYTVSFQDESDFPLRLTERSLQVARSVGDDLLELTAQASCADANRLAGRPDVARMALQTILAQARALAYPAVEAAVLNRLAWCELDIGWHQAAIVAATKAMSVHERQDDQHGIAWQLELLSVIANREGRQPDAIRLARRAWQLLEEIGDRRGVASLACRVAEAELAAGRPAAAAELLPAALTGLNIAGDLRELSAGKRLLSEVRSALSRAGDTKA